MCNPGSFSFSGLEPCTPCAPGTYSATMSAQKCELCPAGTYGARAGLSSAACSGACGSCAVGSTVAITACAAGYFPGAAACVPCPPGTFSVAGAPACSLCPAGTYGASAGLTSATCTGTCSTCGAGSTAPAAAKPLSCIAADSRAVPASLGLMFWPAAHPANPQRVDLVVAPLSQCQQMMTSGACTTAASIVGADGVTRYAIGTA
jgi:hypothetical protein